ncbi:MAG: UDP-N-acetylmuramoyl-tripeptide--D-alanyl-D-alanine ligase [Planctomycetes bacterium]|nr:UDP-N-acetylmuramoyl-tripeptide--D-alanyl-D-alanine ligase [Planctomycetota bacterium]MBU1518413.1 UDP-N-acetylmuramoyl-tripeptide--D-alanyl-D-alanine ligase [Planctomycetota bacterium]MBU2458610.1 UDP-N-acetylmuramoyl-tripeptide--D-alanyl-D-alanine ligase [Planctomycetota bacterium]MBU2596505.1 UDP-N-acetylmuramoyl-tripeptide--D-alanyl-D-alanine ligase [Planctomycetota bacterium]
MIPLNIKKLAEIVKARNTLTDDAAISSVSIDSRKVLPGCVFFAIKGANHDGHDFVNQAFQNGAVCAVVQKKIDTDKPVLLVDDTTGALGELAKYVRENSSYKVVAITGSAGKTTTKNIINHILSTKFRCFSSPKSYNNHIGVPLTILDAPQDSQILISELGSNHIGEIRQLTRIIQPDIAVITTICPAHLEGFGSIDAIIKEKVSITAGLRAGGKFFINGSVKKLVDYCKKQKLSFETFEVPDFKLSGDKSTFVIDNVAVNLPLIGRANVENASAAWAVCKSLGISANQFSESIASVKPVDMRLEPLNLGSCLVLADCYNANPGSMANALETLSLMAAQQGRRAVFICGKMGELGSSSEKLHAELGEKIAQHKIPVLLTTKGDCTGVADAAKKSADYDISIGVFENTTQLCDNMYKFIKPDDIILVKASRSERFEAVVDSLKRLFIGQ